ncbi:MAG: serine/threonine protein kinase [Myxococcota bacterium]
MAFLARPFSRYYLIDKLAVGGMAEVYKAKLFSNHGFEMLLVLKKILPHLSANEEFVQMFVDEAKITVELRHQNIVQVFDFGCYDENYFIAMECVDGKDLKTLLKELAKRGEFIPVELVVYIVHEICKGLDYAHKKTDASGKALGLVHRDVTPANILISYTGEVKIADFGIAKARTSVYNTKDGVLKGKYEYMSPEQAAGETVDFRSDVFEVGILLHEMLTGRRLFHTDSDTKTLELIKSGIYPEPIERHPRVTPRLNQITMRALQKNAATRFADAKAMQSALAECIAPNTPSALADQLAKYLQSTFSNNIEIERNRTRQGTEAAIQLWKTEQPLELDDFILDEPINAPRKNLQTVAIASLAALGGVWLGHFVSNTDPEPIRDEVLVVSPRSLAVTVEPEHAQVKINGKIIESPTIQLNETELQDSLTIDITAAGYEKWSQTIRIGPGEQHELYIQLKELSAIKFVQEPTDNQDP